MEDEGESQGLEGLKRKGWESALAFFDGMSLEEMKKVLGGACERWGLQDFEDLRREAKKQKASLDREENQTMQAPASGHRDNSWVPQSGPADLRMKGMGISLEKARALMPRMVWPTRRQRRMEHAKEDSQREKVEEEERNRQINRLVELLRKADLLQEKSIRDGAASAWMTKRRAMGRRSNTLRAHVRMGERMREFSAGCLGKTWFEEPADVMEYIAGRLEEPCGKSIPGSIMAALRFLEASAEVPMEKRLSEDAVLINFLAEVTKSGWWISRPRVSANRWVVPLVLCLEFRVMESSERSYVRVYSWFKLVKLWAMLRWSDTVGIPALRIRYEDGEGLYGEIVKSKTSGVGRRIEVQQFHVAEGAWLMGEGWLKVGFEMFVKFGREANNEGRDFMMAKPNQQLDGFRSSMVKYSDAMSMSRALLRDLQAPVRRGGVMENIIVCDELGGYWTEHSERVTMASWAAVVGIKQEIIKRWGRWRPSVDEEYVKTTRLLVSKAQEEVARKIRERGMSSDLVGDEEVLKDLTHRLEDMKVAPDTVKKQIKRLRFQQRMAREGVIGAADGEKSQWKVDGEEETSPVESVKGALDLEEWEVEGTDPVVQVGRGTYVMSIVGRSKRRTLHVIGGCYRVPGTDYKDFVILGDTRPELVKGERACGTCFGARDKAMSEVEEIPSSESSSSDLLSSDPDEDSESSD